MNFAQIDRFRGINFAQNDKIQGCNFAQNDDFLLFGLLWIIE